MTDTPQIVSDNTPARHRPASLVGPTIYLPPIAGAPKAAIEHLTKHQRQIDMDGTFVGVSRQALDEVMAYVATRPADDLVPHLVGALERIATVDMGGGFLGAQACREVAAEALALGQSVITAFDQEADRG